MPVTYRSPVQPLRLFMLRFMLKYLHMVGISFISERLMRVNYLIAHERVSSYSNESNKSLHMVMATSRKLVNG